MVIALFHHQYVMLGAVSNSPAVIVLAPAIRGRSDIQRGESQPCPAGTVKGASIVAEGTAAVLLY